MNRTFKILISIILFLIIIAVSMYFIRFNTHFSNTSSDWGNFGSYLSGTVGVMITLASALLLYSTLIQQIRYSSAQDIITQNQQFESNFFKLLETQRDIYKSIEGISRFSKTRIELEQAIQDNCRNGLTSNGVEYNFKSVDSKFLTTLTNETFGKIFVDNSVYLSHYLRHLNTMITYVSKNSLSEKGLYMSMIHSQMSDDELFIAFYNSIATNDKLYINILDKWQFFMEIISTGRIFEMHGHIFFPKTFPYPYTIEDFKRPFGEYGFF